MNKKVNIEKIKKAEQILIDNGIEEDEAQTVLQAIGYALLDEELYPETSAFDVSELIGSIQFCINNFY